ncbi:hypothetical protein SAMN05660826_02208 [Caldanaerovirga acetigignens]|uniref:Uncharacterized protein n=1 Tax=Caldanaerovirga acetigignens TaxID=447595 RepID=A0A1M7M825_9FIRM|nr:hypothetical protein [Caldanaerovirga acetigignens]MCF6097296.1 hypothetical protein [Thermovorax subterraneus]SHM86897.1 hypothetical protein SAMN05660826_02208 [Caldanaerovirga acetigignens]
MACNFTDTEKAVIKFLKENPYSEKKAIIEALGDLPGLEEALEKLSQDMILIELTGPTDSSLESRVPKKIYMVNPEKESELEGI